MRQQGVLNKIIALFALFALVLPASAKVASCLDHAKSKACCMVEASPKQVVAEPTHDCCKPKASKPQSDHKITEGKQGCHCIKAAPTQSLRNFATIIVVESGEKALLPPVEPLTIQDFTAISTNAIFASDSSPPRQACCTSHSGRAPPVF